MLVVDSEGKVTLAQPVPSSRECLVPNRREVEQALRRIQALHGSTVGDDLDVLRRALFAKRTEV